MAFQLKGVKPSGTKSPYLEPIDDKRPGSYVLEVNRCRQWKDRKGSEEYFGVDVRILESDVPHRPPGMECTWMPKKSLDATPGNIVQFLLSAGIEEHEIDDDTADLVCEESQPLATMKIRAMVTQITTRANKLFNRVDWSPYKEVPAKKAAAK